MSQIRTTVMLLAATAGTVALPASSAAADTYTIDASHSKVSFVVSHMVVGRVRGMFSDFSGTVTTDPEDVTKSSVNVAIKVASINTGDAKRDDHLRSQDFFWAEKYPEITFVSERIEKKGDDYVAHGTLTMRGVAKQVALPFEILGTIQDPWGNTRAGVEFRPVTLDRQEYGVSWSKTLDNGGLVVGNDVKVELAAELIKQK